MAQTSYQRGFTAAFAGQLGDMGQTYIRSLANADTVELSPGVFVKASAADACTNLSALTDKVAGITINTFAREPGINSVPAGTGAWAVGATLPVVDRGVVYVLSEEDMAVNDPVYTRVVSHVGVGTVMGAIRNDADTVGTDTCRRLKGARVFGATVTDPVSGLKITPVYFDAAVEYAISVSA